MPMLIVQLAALIAIAFIVGCFLGKLLRGTKGKTSAEEQMLIAAARSIPAEAKADKLIAENASSKTESAGQEQELSSSEITDETVLAETEQSETKVDSPAIEIGRPQWRDAPRRGKADNLTAIHGIGAAVQAMLFKLGIYHYDQIAAWTADEASWIDNKIGFRGRVEREEWVAQAAKLAETTPKTTGKPKKTPVTKARKTGKTAI